MGWTNSNPWKYWWKFRKYIIPPSIEWHFNKYYDILDWGDCCKWGISFRSSSVDFSICRNYSNCNQLPAFGLVFFNKWALIGVLRWYGVGPEDFQYARSFMTWEALVEMSLLNKPLPYVIDASREFCTYKDRERVIDIVPNLTLYGLKKYEYERYDNSSANH